MYKADVQENVETWSLGFRHRDHEMVTGFGNQIVVERGCSARLIRVPTLADCSFLQGTYERCA
jgi:hypothetical protein